MIKLTLSLQLITTLCLTGLMWFVQIVHYPLFSSIGAAELPEYLNRQSVRMTRLVLIPMLFELLAAVILVAKPSPDEVPVEYAWIGLTLVGLIWVSTIFVQVPLQVRLGNGYSEGLHRTLLLTNWVRTWAWTARSLLAFWLLVRTSVL